MATYDITFIIAIHRGEKPFSEKKETDQECTVSLFLEYGSIPNLSKQKIEILLLDQTAQIKGFDTNFTSETLEHEDLVWIVFSLMHIVELDQKDVAYIISNDMELSMWTQKAKAKTGKKATKQKEKEKIETDDQENPWNSWIKMALTQEIVPPATEEENIAEGNTPKNTIANIPHFQHWVKILEDIKEVSEQFQEDQANKEKEAKIKIDEKQKRKGKTGKEPQKDIKNTSETKKTEKTTIKINLAPLFAGRHVKSQIMIKEQGFVHVSVIVSGKNLMEENVAEELNPFVIKINQVKNIPFQILNNLGINTIFIKYDVFDEIMETEKKKISVSNVLIDHAKVLLTNKIPNSKLLEYLQTSRLLLTVVGVKTEICPIEIKDVEVTTMSKKQKRKQQTIVNEDQPQTYTEIEKHVEIAVTHCNLSNLLNGQMFLEEDLPLYIAPFSKENLLLNTNGNQITDMNQELMLYFSSIEIFVSFTLPLTLQSARLDPTGHTNYNRMLLFIKDDQVANSILESIVSFNIKILSQIDLTEENKEEKFMHDNEHILTGFLLDTPHFTLIFIEGIYDGFILQVYRTIRNLSSITCKVLYDSKLVFTSRLYSSLFPTPGIHIIISTNAFDKQLEKASCHIEEVKTKLHWQAIKLIDALIKCNDIQTASQDKLFPSTEQLTSLDINSGTSEVKNSDEHESIEKE